MKKEYVDKVSLLVETIPFIAKESCFALKGGTAINLFHSDMRRLSIDIDLTYIYFDERAEAYQNINQALGRIVKALTQAGFTAVIQGSNEEKKVIVSNPLVSIKIEPNYTVRGHVYTPKVHGICGKAEQDYGYVEIQIVSVPELYGGKMCAALDRQHPRDLFDIRELLAVTEKDSNLMSGFLAMLLGHNRPVHELLDPLLKDQSEVFDKEFSGMTDTNFLYMDHIHMFEELVMFVQKEIKPYKKFLLDFVSLKPDFQTLGIPNLERMPAIHWKLQNLEKLKKSNPGKFNEQYDKLVYCLDHLP